MQSAILYTTVTGERRVRVHTISLPTTTALATVFRGADLDAQFSFLLKHGERLLLSRPSLKRLVRIGQICPFDAPSIRRAASWVDT